jgi:uncharacterized protein YodC (DUF2158 family)
MSQGNVVRLNSGGPEMTVINVVKSDAIVEWHDGTKYVRSSFPVACLTLVKKDVAVCQA